ncbi:restriction endonuclease subunit S [Enterococcus faecalis]|uniref:restriction endonuclease subunit S n=11 Tax=Enterococcus faecalis TaxID=1351 RepID=UPI00027C6E30|nr:restriction endonuclease subunit S [Enterococcus faecalis]EGO2822793.1 restriction endonuclease subunit S [Enterococcus faecalis]EGO9271981.1 restriction endonuclease subunit S [Enterococcus faecalis]EGO9353375.1 restriction endonuclease subunit S [Enterococcus faecalis]EGO9360277.1 restriction endonuclease subunit S [Enterococcus faecalis]EJV05512.1 type I restriction modification DNA specificity domain protein [Enterococcus faecalis ERV62]
MRDEMKKAPRLRFRGFQEDWELCKLKEIVDVRSGRDYKHLGSGNIPVYGTGGYMLSVSEALSYDEDAIGIGRKGTINNPYILKAPFWTVDTLFYAIPKNNFDLNFIYSIFRKINWKSKDESTGVPSLSKTTINAVTVYIPSGSEQQRIGEFFKQIDNTITLHQRKLDQLKELKKAYLQLMFASTNTKNDKLPKLRFTGFKGYWELCKLSDISDKVKEKNKHGKFTETLTNSAEYGIINQRFFFDKDISNANNLDSYYVVQNDDFVYNPRISNFAPVGPIKRNKLGRTGVMSPLYYVFRTHSIDNNYLEKYFDTVYWHHFMELNGDTGARADRFAIKDSIFVEMPIPYPSTEEQKKIGIFFKKLDQSITLYKNKLNQLKTLKKSYLQNMFI